MNDYWDRPFADLMLSVVAGLKGKRPRVKKTENWRFKDDTLKQCVGDISNRLFNECQWSLRMEENIMRRREPPNGGSEFIEDGVTRYNLVLINEYLAIISTLLRVSFSAGDNLFYITPFYSKRKTVKAELGALPQVLAETLIGEHGVMKEYLVWRLQRMQRIQNRKDNHEDKAGQTG